MLNETKFANLGGVKYTEVILIIGTWSSEIPLKHLRNPTPNTRNFPRVNIDVNFGLKSAILNGNVLKSFLNIDYLSVNFLFLLRRCLGFCDIKETSSTEVLNSH